jgi:hypothetical protein
MAQGPPYVYETDAGTITSDRPLSPADLLLFSKVGQRESAKEAPIVPVAPDLNEALKGAVMGPVGKVNEVLGTARSGTRAMMPENLPNIVKELVNPVPGNIGEAAALFAAPAAGLATRGAAGVGPSLARGLAPAAAGAAGDAVSGDSNIGSNLLLRLLFGLGAEGVGGAASAYKRVRGLPRGKDTAQTAERMADTGSRITGRDIEGTPAGLARAGEASPRIGSKADASAAGSLEAALEGKQRQLYHDAAQVVGSRVNVDLPTGQRVSFKKALDEYKGAVAGKVDADGNRIDGERIWASMMDSLVGSGEADLMLLARQMNVGRSEHAKSMSFVRQIEGMKTEGLLDPKGNFDMQKLQARFHKLAEEGLIDPAVRDQIERSTKRGYSGPLTDEPGKTNLGTWFRLSPGGVGGGFHPKLPEMPRQVGTGPRGLAPETEPLAGLPRVLLSILGLLGAQGTQEANR